MFVREEKQSQTDSVLGEKIYSLINLLHAQEEKKNHTRASIFHGHFLYIRATPTQPNE